MESKSQGFVLKDGAIKTVEPVISIQIESESELQDEKMEELAPTSIAYLAGWAKAWQKKTDGTWVGMGGGE